ncbi:hypothetical protein [Saccharothrix lopnurensis]|uniref:Membrane-associated oxidoreductase n=1 Tax=Saccharothrix lopnurensis TaxID=1670621 RepID=A0ABW1PG29_9PSEU
MSESQTPPVLDNLSPLEEAVVAAACRGTWTRPDTDLTPGQLADTEDPGLRVRAELIRELLMGRRGELDPRGVLIRGVRVVGELDLDHVIAVTGLALLACSLPDGITCIHARLHQVDLRHSTITDVNAESVRTDGSLLLRGARLTGSGERGALRLFGAHIGGQLGLDSATVTNTTGPALNADDVRTDGSLLLSDAHLTGSGEDGALRLFGAHIGGQLALDSATVTNTTGPGLDADHIRTDGHLLLSDAHLTGSGEDGALRLPGAHIDGQLDLERATVTNTTGPALDADRIRTDDDLLLSDAHLTGSGEDGALRLLGAHIDGQLDLERATVTNTTGPALDADRIRTDDDLLLSDAHLTGSGEDGALRLLGAHIDGQLDLERATVTNTTGPALNADDVRTDGSLLLSDAHLTGSGERGALRLLGAHIGGQAYLTGTRLTNESGPLLVLTEARVDGALFLPAVLVCPQAGQTTSTRPCPDSPRQLVARGLVFPQLRDISWRQWLHLLVHHTPGYLPQPYQQLAAVERAAGHDNNARHILITQQDDLRRRTPDALGGHLARGRHRLWGWLGRYGYRAHRLVTALLTVLLLAGATGYTAGQVPTRAGHHAAERVTPPNTPTTAAGIPCSTAELIGLGIDRGLPLGATGLRARCDLDTGTRKGQAFTYLLWALQAIVWALATLTIAAYTGLIRKTA